MAHLPPRAPNMTQNWPDFSPHQKIETTSITTVNHHHHNPSWVDEFLDFSSAKRGSHRRSISDSIAFLETPMVEECRIRLSSSGTTRTTGAEFERFDDEQLMSMFNDDITNNNSVEHNSNPSSPSDHNSINHEEKKMNVSHEHQLKIEPEEVQSSCKSDNEQSAADHADNSSEKIVDPKRIKR